MFPFWIDFSMTAMLQTMTFAAAALTWFVSLLWFRHCG